MTTRRRQTWPISQTLKYLYTPTKTRQVRGNALDSARAVWQTHGLVTDGSIIFRPVAKERDAVSKLLGVAPEQPWPTFTTLVSQCWNADRTFPTRCFGSGYGFTLFDFDPANTTRRDLRVVDHTYHRIITHRYHDCEPRGSVRPDVIRYHLWDKDGIGEVVALVICHQVTNPNAEWIQELMK